MEESLTSREYETWVMYYRWEAFYADPKNAAPSEQREVTTKRTTFKGAKD